MNRILKSSAGFLPTIAAVALLAGAAAAQTAGPTPNAPLEKAIGEVTQSGPVASLFVLNARGAALADGKLTLTGISPSSIAFADRPVRAAGHIETAQFVEKWKQGEDQANIDPPNATVSVLSGADVADAVVTISAPVLDGDTLTFDAVVLEGTLTGATGPAALFIDRGGFGGFHGGGMAGGFHGGGDFREAAEATTSRTMPTSRIRIPPGTAPTRAIGRSTTTRTTTSTAAAATTVAAFTVILGQRAQSGWQQGLRSPTETTTTTIRIPIPTAAIHPIHPAIDVGAAARSEKLAAHGLT